MAINRDEALGGLVKRYREMRGFSQAAVAEMLTRETGETVNQNIVSENERGRRWTKRPGFPAAYARALGIPRQEIQAAMGLPDEGRTEHVPTFAEIVQADETLSRAAKEHLINQYGLLQLASKGEVPAKRRQAKRAG